MFTFHDFLNVRNRIDREEYSSFIGQKIQKPKWLLTKPDDNLNLVCDSFERFYSSGEVYLSCILRANSALFRQISGDRPAQMLYTKDEYFYSHPEELLKISDSLYSIKQDDTYNYDDYEELSKILNDDYYRPLNVKIPLDITNDHDVWVTSVMMVKEHIPFHKISNFFYPLLVVSDEPLGGMIVPKWFWSKGFCQYSNFHSHNEVKPNTYADVPNGARDFFEPFSSLAFFKEHPVHYILFSILEIVSLVTPFVTYVRVCDLFPNKVVTDFNVTIGIMGTILIGCGFINIIWSFMDKYLGNRMTIKLFACGIVLVILSIVLMVC